jgi:hypothetical protein
MAMNANTYGSGDGHPFHVGGLYANRNGEYEVVEIAPPKMTVRYHNGGTLVADIAILARIWENLQAPPEAPEPRPRAARSTTARPTSARPPAAPKTVATPRVAATPRAPRAPRAPRVPKE